MRPEFAQEIEQAHAEEHILVDHARQGVAASTGRVAGHFRLGKSRRAPTRGCCSVKEGYGPAPRDYRAASCAKKSLPLSSTRMKAGKLSTSIL